MIFVLPLLFENDKRIPLSKTRRNTSCHRTVLHRSFLCHSSVEHNLKGSYDAQASALSLLYCEQRKEWYYQA